MEISAEQWYRILAPRAVVLVSTINNKGVSNAAPFSFVMPCSVKPPLIEFSSAPGHHTVKNILKKKEFVVNIPGEALAEKLWVCGSDFPEGVSEIKKAGLTEIKSMKVKVPAIKECLAYIECKLFDKFKTGDHITIVGKVVRTYIKDGYYAGSSYDVLKASPLMHIGGKRFGITGKIVEVK